MGFRRFLHDEDGCPYAEVLGHDGDGAPILDVWGAAGEDLFEADPADEWDDEDLDELDLDDVPDPDRLPAEGTPDYSHLFEPAPDPEDEAWWAEQCHAAPGD